MTENGDLEDVDLEDVDLEDVDLEDVEENLRILIAEELETQHRLESHARPVEACPVCRAHSSPRARS